MVGRFLFSCMALLVADCCNAQTAPRLASGVANQSSIESAKDSVVAIVRANLTPDTAPEPSSFMSHDFGTGVVIDSSGLILTNYHLLGNVKQSSYGIWHRQQFYYANVIAADPWTDLAILRANDANLPAIKLRIVATDQTGPVNDRIAAEQPVVALGNPYRITRTGEPTSVAGTIQGIEQRLKDFRHDATTLYRYGGLFRTDARVQIGASGGPILDQQGRMIGLVTSGKALEGYDSISHFAIPMTKEIHRVMATLKTGREVSFGFLGIDPAPKPIELNNGKTGVLINQVLKRTPAADAGLFASDVITHIDGIELKEVNDLLLRVGAALAEDTVRLTIIRTDPILRRTRVSERDVVLTKRFVATTRPVIATTDLFRWRGLSIDYYTAARSRSELVGDAPEHCVRVIDVERDSACWTAGLRVGQLVEAVNGVATNTPASFQTAVFHADGPIEVRVHRKGQLVVEPAPQQ